MRAQVGGATGNAVRAARVSAVLMARLASHMH
jgi:hypothetical protein